MEAGEYERLSWLSDDPKPTIEELESLWPIVQYEVEKETIESERIAEYQKISDPLFFQYQRGEATEQEWLDAVQSIKNMYPYPAPLS
jgi:hypothetical protein